MADRLVVHYFAAARTAAGVDAEELALDQLASPDPEPAGQPSAAVANADADTDTDTDTDTSADSFAAADPTATTPPTVNAMVATVNGPTLAMVVPELVRRHGPGLDRVLARCSFLVDGIAARSDTVLTGATRLDVLPPFAGG